MRRSRDGMEECRSQETESIYGRQGEAVRKLPTKIGRPGKDEVSPCGKMFLDLIKSLGGSASAEKMLGIIAKETANNQKKRRNWDVGLAELVETGYLRVTVDGIYRLTNQSKKQKEPWKAEHRGVTFYSNPEFTSSEPLSVGW